MNEFTITITPHWQIHIPVEARKQLGLDKPVKAILRIENKKMIISPEKSKLMRLAGKYKNRKPNRPIDIDNIRDYIDFSERI